MRRMKFTKTSIVTLFTISFLILSSSVISINIGIISNPPSQKDLYLLRVEHYLELAADDDTNNFHVKYVFPPDYSYQVPIVMEIFNDTTANILDYKIEKDFCEPNRVVNFTIASMHKDEHKLLHFTIWVLVENFEFKDIPKNTPFPKKKDLPEDTIEWLQSTKAVQARSPVIILKAKQLRAGNNDIFSYAKNVSHFIKYHRFLLFLLELKLGLLLSQDAITTLFINGENVGRSHLACALFRSQNIPARVLLANNDQGFWTQMHYMVEYYLPNYGWILLDSTKGETPYATKRQIINRICSIDDEKDTKRDYIFHFMTCEERWIWLDTEKIHPYYVDCKTGSKSQMFQEAESSIDTFTADYTIFRTKTVFHAYEYYITKTLNSEESMHFNKAVNYQEQAVHILSETNDLYQYIYFMDKAYDEYKLIEK